jgi:hypothetical protein
MDKCFSCGGTEFWLQGTQKLCVKCNPDPNAKEKSKLQLIERIKRGHDQIAKTWETLQSLVPDYDDPEYPTKDAVWRAGLAQWCLGAEKLWALVTELNVVHGFGECLYPEMTRACENCWVCTCDSMGIIRKHRPPVGISPAVPVVDLFKVKK